MPSNLILWYAGDLALAGTILVLLRRGTAARYRAWWTFLVLQLLRDITLALTPYNTLVYAYVFMGTELIVDVVLARSVYEWFQLLAEHYPGIKFAGTWFLNIAFGVSFLICLATLGPDVRAIDWSAPELYVVLLVKRVVVGVLGVFVILVFLAFLAYRVRVRPNVIWHGLLLMTYLALQNALSVTEAWSRLHSVHTTNYIRSIGTAVIYLGWALLLSRQGEKMEIKDRLSEDARTQLDRLNEELLVLARSMRGI